MKCSRKCERQVGTDWVEIKFKDLRRGDRFRLFENDGLPVMVGENHITLFLASSDAYKKDGIWRVETA